MLFRQEMWRNKIGRAVILLVAVWLLTFGLGWQGLAGSAQAANNCQTFEKTSYRVCGRFLQYWQTHGGLAQQGLPISNEFEEVNAPPPAGDGKLHTVQYFERARFELHEDNAAPYDVLLGLLGRDEFATKYKSVPAPTEQSGPCQYFRQTDLKVCGRFLEYWLANGGLAQQGLPISGVINEQNAPPPAGDGQTHPVQYFERARFELHSENAAPYDVLLGLLGTQEFTGRYNRPGAPAQVTYPGKFALAVVDSDAQVNRTIEVANGDNSLRTIAGEGKSPLLSPDGTRVAFVHRDLNRADPLRSTSSIYVTDRDGKNLQELCPDSADAAFDLKSWSPDGKTIAVSAGQQLLNTVILCDLTTGKYNYSPPVVAAIVWDWSLTGQNALWQAVSASQGAPNAPRQYDLYYGDPSKGQAAATRLTNGENNRSFSDIHYYLGAKLSPDGKTVAVVGSKLFFLSVPGQQSPLAGKSYALPSDIGADNAVSLSLAWSPDGQYVALATPAQAKTYLLKASDGTSQDTSHLTGYTFGGWSK